VPLFTHPQEAPQLLAARVRLLYENGKSANIAVLLVVALLGGALYTFSPSWLMLGWIACMYLLVGLRLWLVRGFVRDAGRYSDAEWLDFYVIATALVGLAWAVVPIWLMPQDAPSQQVLVIVFVIGMTSAGIAVLLSSTAAVMLYTLPAMLALIGKLFWLGWVDSSGYWMAGLLLMLGYPFTHIRTALNAHRAVVKSLQLDEHNRELITQLQSEIVQRENAQQALENNQRQLETLVALRTAELEKEVFEREQAQHDAEMAAEAAERANLAKSEFLANMSHELRTPMHAVLSFAEMGRKRVFKQQPPEKIASYFERIDTSGKRLMHLLSGLLDLARLEAGKVQLQHDHTTAGALLRSLCEEMQPLAEKRQISLLRAPGETRLPIEGDEARLLQVLRNLVGNAIKFSPPQSSVEIDCQPSQLKREDGMQPALLITISDHGPGIPADELKTIFERFTQSSATRTGAGGTGLGLAICREIVELHGGEISARNRPDGGAQFRVLLPLATDETQSESDSETDAA
jgi:signal transduction histidine kinase